MKNLLSSLVWSSADPNKVSATITGFIISLSSLIILVAGYYGFSIAPEQITASAAQLGTAIGSIVFIFGLIRKIIIAINLKVNPQDA